MVEPMATAQQAAGAFPVTWVWQALALSRATYYRWQAAAPGANQDLEVRAQIQDIALGDARLWVSPDHP